MNKSLNKIFILTMLLLSTKSALADAALDQEAKTYSAIFKSLPKDMFEPGNVPSEDKISLGKKLYLEKELSVNKDLSCNSCHKLDSYGVDNEPTSSGTKGQKGNRNSPTSFNAALHVAQFWDGRAKDVEAQALGPILNPVEMAMPSKEEVVKRISSKPEYVALFKKAFPGEGEPITYDNIGKAIGAFERTLVTPSKFDKYLNGDDKALSDDEKKGMLMFSKAGCITCHNGVAVGGAMYQKLGLVKPYPTKDLGRYEHTKNEADKYFFKVPSLRNVEKTAPYFHDGSIKTLPEAVKLMASHQLGRDLSDDEIGQIVTFLKTLTGEVKVK